MGAAGGLQRLVEDGLTSRLLMKNYDRPNRESWEKCKELVIDYVLQADTVRGKEPVFVKRLTKIGARVWQEREHSRIEDPKTAHVYLGHLYKFNLEGARCMWQRQPAYSLQNQLSMLAHFYGYAADAAEQKNMLSEVPVWAVRWWRHARVSGILAMDLDPVFSAHRSISAGNAAMELYEVSRNPMWCDKAKSHYEDVIAIAGTTNNIFRLRRHAERMLGKIENYALPRQQIVH